MRRFIFSLVLSGFSISGVFSQGTAITPNGAPPDPSAMFQVSSPDKGVLVPRMTDGGRDSIINPADGLLIYNITTKCFNFFKNSSWFELCGNCVYPPLAVVANSGPVCAGGTINLTASTVPNVSYTWTGPNGFSSTAQNPVLTNVTTANSGVYQVSTTRNNCTGAWVSTTVVVNPIPSGNFTFSPSTAGINSDVTFSPVETGATYAWTFQSGTPATSTATNPIVQWSTTGTYNVGLSVSKNGCNASSAQTITVSSCIPFHTITYNFTHSVPANSTDCGNWTNFRSSLTPGVYCSVTLSGTQYPQGYTCTDPVAVNQIATFIKSGTSGTVVLCNGMKWSNDDVADWLYVYDNTGASCTKNASLRPCIANENWGGFNTQICAAPTQTITLTFNK
ncbi:MAG: hypothetical protein WCM76_15985 [Bacteroidota bacterium]